MVVSSSVARRYAQSLVQIAQEKGMLDKVKSDMEGILALSKDSRDFVVMLQSPVVSHDKKKTILKQIFSGKIETLSMNFIELLTRKARENGLIDIATAFLRIYQEVNGIQPARIVSAIPLSAAAREEVSSSLAKATNKKIELAEEVKEDLIGGYILRVEDKQIDSSVKSQLQQLKNKFRS